MSTFGAAAFDLVSPPPAFGVIAAAGRLDGGRAAGAATVNTSSTAATMLPAKNTTAPRLPDRRATNPLRNGSSMHRYDTSASTTDTMSRAQNSDAPCKPDVRVRNTSTGQ